MTRNQYHLGIDIGGTFTDINLLDKGNERIVNLKVPTNTTNPVLGVLNGISLLKEKGIPTEEINYIVHGQTIGLNTLLQRSGSQIGLFVTDGFRDILALQRLRLPVPYDFRSRLPEPIIPRENVFPIKERLLHDGSVHTELDLASVDAAIDQALESNLKGIAVCFLYSYSNPIHEQKVLDRIRERAPMLEVCISSSLWSQAREYERAIITTINLFIQDKVKSYFQSLEKSLRENNINVTPHITQSNGGIMHLMRASEEPIRTLFSGPASGVIGATRIAETAGISNVITLDMGGTSADMSIIENGHAKYTQNSEIGGFPITLPTISINAIGAGGGSLAWIDQGGLLKVGPESAGSDPGPACYGKSEKPALTDAFLLCGYINPNRFAGGSVSLYPERSQTAFEEIADYLDIGVRDAADRVIQVAITKMYSELQNVIERQGIDPRDFSLLAFGGAGAIVANFLAEELYINRVLIPPSPGTLCALGSLSADFINDVVESEKKLIRDMPLASLRASYKKLVDNANKWLEEQDSSNLEGSECLFYMDARYKGQSHETELLIDASWLQTDNHDLLEKGFHDHHKKHYGHNDLEASIEVISLRVRIIGYTQSPPYSYLEIAQEEAQPIGVREISYRGNIHSAKVFQRSNLLQGHCLTGPAIVEQDDSTTLILDGWEGTIDAAGNLVISQVSNNQKSGYKEMEVSNYM